jgi:hypothetical protein
MMTSARRAQINRNNASHSTGPKGEKGKQKACMNGFKHGLTGPRMILRDHEVDAYRRLGAALHADYQPQTEIESQLVQHIVDCNMRLNRAAAIDSSLLNVGLAENTNDDAPDAITESVIAQTRAWTRQADSFDKLGRYEARISRQMLQYVRELDRIQGLRKSQPIAQEISSETTESNTGNSELASFRTCGQACALPAALSSQEPNQGRTALVGASLRRTSSPDYLPRFMTAISINSRGTIDTTTHTNAPAATVSSIQPSFPNSGGNLTSQACL